jgi:hypothetical protein
MKEETKESIKLAGIVVLSFLAIVVALCLAAFLIH